MYTVHKIIVSLCVIDTETISRSSVEGIMDD